MRKANSTSDQKGQKRGMARANKRKKLTEEDLQQSILQTYQKARANMKENTRKQYLPKMAEFLKWCELNFTKTESDWDWVTGLKLHKFLHDEVIDRVSKRKRTSSTNHQLIQYDCIKQYKQAVVKLYNWQVTEGRFHELQNPSPNIQSVKDLMNDCAKNIQHRKIENYEDRGINNSLLDGYRRKDLPRISSFFFGMNNDLGMKNRICQLLLHHNCMRWDNGRMIELPDIFHHDLENEGIGGQECFAVVVILRQGKTNQFGRTEYNGMIRNKDVRVCPMGGMGLWFFWRFHVQKERFQSFGHPEDWFYVKLICGSSEEPTSDYHYLSHYRCVCAAFEAYSRCNVLYFLFFENIV